MNTLRVLGLRDVLLEHLLLEHEATLSPQGGLPPDLKAALRRITPDCLVNIHEAAGGQIPATAMSVLTLSSSASFEQTGVKARPLLSLSGVITARSDSGPAFFKALSAQLLHETPAAEAESGTASHVCHSVNHLSQPDLLVGVLHGLNKSL